MLLHISVYIQSYVQCTSFALTLTFYHTTHDCKAPLEREDMKSRKGTKKMNPNLRDGDGERTGYEEEESIFFTFSLFMCSVSVVATHMSSSTH